jgi:hypothetical protein
MLSVTGLEELRSEISGSSEVLLRILFPIPLPDLLSQEPGVSGLRNAYLVRAGRHSQVSTLKYEVPITNRRANACWSCILINIKG